jgi:hypothetical protein
MLTVAIAAAAKTRKEKKKLAQIERDVLYQLSILVI